MTKNKKILQAKKLLEIIKQTLEYGEDVLITGAGPIGCMAAAVVKHAGARYVVVTDVNPWRLELAKKMGATRVVDIRTEKISDAQQSLGMVEGYNFGCQGMFSKNGNIEALAGAAMFFLITAGKSIFQAEPNASDPAQRAGFSKVKVKLRFAFLIEFIYI